ncbi:hypothetical protein P154DRAFT_536301 [Amniculicola lignicola CBS 123094]|uniref:Uncharacterized protein n=1 Tax=Amniculicola lignicola CBS 123094 TaxID=1392246 RepID=A0A6A5WCK9_9PLEO|nr:hypothetical protein P154DRAFT_536301 [Amniculicola lignicola CBS 123094]
MTVPIMCNTSFMAPHSRECLPLNGTFALGDYAASIEGNPITKGFFSLKAPETGPTLLGHVTGTTDSVLASRTLSLRAIQAAAEELRGHADIVRLILTGQTRLITAACRAASTWKQYLSSKLMPGSLVIAKGGSMIALCRVTHIESKTHASSHSGLIWRWVWWDRVGVFMEPYVKGNVE